MPLELPDGTKLPVTGWVAYSKVPYRNEEMAGVRVYARGKIVASTRDFGLSSGEAHDLALHRAGCVECRRVEVGLRADADVARGRSVRDRFREHLLLLAPDREQRRKVVG